MSNAKAFRRKVVSLGLPVVFAAAIAPAVFAQVPKEPVRSLDVLEFFRPELAISTSNVRLEQVVDQLPNRTAWQGFLEQRAAVSTSRMEVLIDPRSATAVNLLTSQPLIPGNGSSNQLTMADLTRSLGRPVSSLNAEVVGEATRRHALRNRDLLGIDARQLGVARATQVNGNLWQVTIPQMHQGIPVRDGRVLATISHGNVVVMGTEAWGNVRIAPTASISAARALENGFAYAGGRAAEDVMIQAPRLEIVPIAPPQYQVSEAFAGPIGTGYDHWLVWTFIFRRPPEVGHWEVMVDAASGEVVAFVDKIQHQQRQVTGGVYPITSTGVCPNAAQCGIMQSNWPMPFTDTGLVSPNNFTNSAGIFNFTSGTVTTTLTGRFVDIVDNCGAITASSTTGNLNLLGTNGQHNCTSAGFSAGNTASSRSAFYEVNKIFEQARGWLPTNTWLQSRLTTNVNIVNTCNAFWNGISINFFRSGGGCRNTGELAGVFDHEWGHGLDDNDAAGALSNSSEAYADIAAIYRLQTSCVGHGFFDNSSSGTCGLTVDGTGRNANENQAGPAPHCNLDCSGVRDADWDKHADHQPDTPLGFVCGNCNTGPGPCGRQVHCAAAPSRQAAWDLAARDLQAAPFNYDTQTAFILANKLFYQGSGNIGSWHACTCGASSNGCGAANGYMQWLAADDDNGNLNDGTPHMTAIFNAFNRHGIACATPAPTNAGCSGGPTAAPSTLTATPGNYRVGLSWSAVSGAARYWVFRTEGHAGCNFGKARIADVTSTTFTDTQVANGREYFYNVVPAGASSACVGRASTCVSATPNLPTTPDFTVVCNPSSLNVQQGGSGASNCTVTSLNGFTAAVSLSCAGLPSGATCSFSPNPVTPPAGGNVTSTATVSVSGTTQTGTFPFEVQGVSGALTRTAAMNLNVTGTGGGGAQTALFDTGLQAPRCAVVGSSCDSGASLLLGRDGRGPEPNQPNTINDSCADGPSGTFHLDESNDRIRVLTTDGTNFGPGKTVRVEATVWAWTTPSQDRLDLYFAANASSPSWTFITTLTPTVAGASTLSATYVLPSGGNQAVRARFRYQGAATPCSAGSFNDHDDLVFAVETPATTTIFADGFEFDRGWIRNPIGTDTATSGLWERGDPEPTDSAGPKQLGTTVSGVNDLVTGRLAGASAGIEDIDGGVTSIVSPTIALPSTGTLTLSFSYYFAHGLNSSNADFLRVRVVGTTTATVFARLGAALDMDAAWATASASLNAFAGQTVRIWIDAADLSTASLVEAAVDDVTITQQ